MTPYKNALECLTTRRAANTRRCVLLLSLCGAALSAGCRYGRTEVAQKLVHNAQTAVVTTSQSPIFDNAIIRRGGWEIPPKVGAEIITARRVSKSVESPRKIFVTEYKPLRTITTEGYRLTGDERRLLKLSQNEEHAFVNLKEFDAEGRRFCVAALVGTIKINPQTQERLYCCEYTSIDFYDMDGDGVFELLRRGPYYGLKPLVPDWVTQKSGPFE